MVIKPMALNNNNTHSYGKLQQFIKHLHKENIQYQVDPYNTFLCQIKMVEPKPPEASTHFKILENLHVGINKDYDPGSVWYPITKDIHSLIEDISIPKISSAGETLSLLHGKYQTFTTYPLMTEGTFNIKFLNTAPNPIIETIIYPWMKECSLGFSEKTESKDLDYPRADLTIVFPHLYILENPFLLNSDSIPPYYKYFNIRPINIEPYSPSNKPAQTLYRNVVFAFDYFTVLNKIY